MATLTNAGYERQNTLDYLDKLKSKVLAIRNDWDLSPSSYDGKLLQIIAEVFGAIDQTMAEIYAAMDPETAGGDALKNHATANGVTPRLGTFSTATVTLSGTDGTVVPKSTQIKNVNTGTIWVTDEAATIPSDVGVRCQTRGEQTANAGELSQIVASISGWQGVTNDDPALLGSPAETDAELRVRVRLATGGKGSNQLTSIIAEIAEVPNISHLKVIQNNENHTVDGVNANSIIVFYKGADPKDIANAFMRKKPPGSNANYGNTTYPNRSDFVLITPTRTVQTAGGTEVQVGGSDTKIGVFEVDAVPVKCKVSLRLTQSKPEGLELRIKDAIMQYANATLFAPSSDLGFDRTGFEIGEDLHAGKLFTPVNKVLGEYGYIDTSVDFGVAIGKDAANATEVSIELNQIGVFSHDDIDVVIL